MHMKLSITQEDPLASGCACHQHGTCEGDQLCHCDSAFAVSPITGGLNNSSATNNGTRRKELTDEGHLTNRAHLPVTKLNFVGTGGDQVWPITYFFPPLLLVAKALLKWLKELQIILIKHPKDSNSTCLLQDFHIQSWMRQEQQYFVHFFD